MAMLDMVYWLPIWACAQAGSVGPMFDGSLVPCCLHHVNQVMTLSSWLCYEDTGTVL